LQMNNTYVIHTRPGDSMGGNKKVVTIVFEHRTLTGKMGST
jgi:hypothetical protein